MRRDDYERDGILRGKVRLAAAAWMITEWIGASSVGDDACPRTDDLEASGGGDKGAPVYQPVFADIGTDHAYLPIALCEAGVIGRAIAGDINEGPLAIARSHIAAAGLSDKIELRLSDGLSGLCPGEADVIAICGMGGELVLSILDSNIAAARTAGFLVLGPQSKVYETRVGLRDRGFMIAAEDMVFEDGKFYPLIGAVPVAGAEESKAGSQRYGAGGEESEAGSQRSAAGGSGRKTSLPEGSSVEEKDLRECFDRYGRLLIASHHPVLRQFLEKEEQRLSAIEGRVTGEKGNAVSRQLFLCRMAKRSVT